MSGFDLEVVEIDGDGLMLDAVLWQRFRRPTPGLAERTMDINPGLAALGPVLPHGTRIMIPIEKQASVRVMPVVSLWD